MIPSQVNFHKPNSLSEALDLLGGNQDAKLLAGGHSLIPLMKLRLNEPDSVISIGNLEELRGISDSDGSFRIGAGTTHSEIAMHQGLRQVLPVITQAAASIGDIQVRNFGTIGGSIAHADPAADWPGALLASGATLELASQSGQRKVAASDFFQGFFSTALNGDEIITAIIITKPPAGTRSGYLKFAQPASRFAIVGCAALVSGDPIAEIAVAFNGVSDTPFRDAGIEGALKGKTLSEEAIAKAASMAADGRDILSDHHASSAYRHHLAKIYAKRTLNSLM
ncbi:MAG: xanthine dehydrogenase family protein subunit M [Saprospiraceae bacterium]|nr:xanthine dehydrogenase family protein subunit M [Saprospiraceae bacterium]